MTGSFPLAPGRQQVLGEDNFSGRAHTLIRFVDGSELMVHWDGRHSVAGLADTGPVIVYCPNGRRLHIPWHRIDIIDHQDGRDR